MIRGQLNGRFKLFTVVTGIIAAGGWAVVGGSLLQGTLSLREAVSAALLAALATALCFVFFSLSRWGRV